MLIADIVRWHGHKTPDRVALKWDKESLSYGQLLSRVNQVANAMSGLGQVGDRVGILAENLPAYVECYYGVPDAGMALNFLNYRLHPKEWTWILNNAEANILLVQDKFLEAIEPFLGEIPTLKHVVVIGSTTGKYPSYEDLVGSASPEHVDRKVEEDSMAWLIYTSGTTGFPKGAMLSHRNLSVGILNAVIEYEIKSDEVDLVAFPLCHVSGWFVPVHHFRGGTVVLCPAFEAELWMQLVQEHQVTNTALAPTMLNMVLEHPKCNDYDLSSLRGLLYGAAAMPVEVLRRGIERLGPVVYSGFGMTELSGNVLTFPKSDHVRAINGEEHLLLSCGKPMVMAEVKVVDEDGNESPPGEVGEIVIRGEQTLTGYFRNEEGTRKAYEGGWFHSGDMARRDEEGFFYIVDRMKDMIITGGENVYSREVEEVIYVHPGVSEAAIIGLPDEVWGERVVVVVAMKQGVEGGDAVAAEIIKICRERLAGYKCPKQVFFIAELPKNVSGKILKRELRDQFAG